MTHFRSVTAAAALAACSCSGSRSESEVGAVLVGSTPTDLAVSLGGDPP